MSRPINGGRSRRSILRVMGIATTLAMLPAAFGGAPAHAQQTGVLQEVMQRSTVRIAIVGGNPPYTKMNPSGEPEGYEIDMGNMIAAALKVKPEFIVTDIPGRIVSLQTHKVDITIATFTKTVERSKSIAFTDPYLVTGLQFLVSADREDLKTVGDLSSSKITIGITRGGTAEQNVPLAAPGASIARFDNVSDNLLALNAKQVDAMSQDNLYNADLVSKNPGKYKVIPGLYSYEEIAIGLPAGDFDWWRVMNAWVGQFNASGDNARLFKKWFGYDLPPIRTQY